MGCVETASIGVISSTVFMLVSAPLAALGFYEGDAKSQRAGMMLGVMMPFAVASYLDETPGFEHLQQSPEGVEVSVNAPPSKFNASHLKIR